MLMDGDERKGILTHDRFHDLRVMTRIVIVGLYYKSKIVGFNP